MNSTLMLHMMNEGFVTREDASRFLAEERAAQLLRLAGEKRRSRQAKNSRRG